MEDRKTGSREELQQEIRTIEEQLEGLRKAESPNIAEINRLLDILDEKENALIEMAELEGAQNSGTDFESAKLMQETEKKEEKEQVEISEKQEVEQEEAKIKAEEYEKNLEEQQIKDNESDSAKDKLEANKKDEENLNEKNFEEKNETTFTLTQWQLKTGIDIIADDAIRRKYPEQLSEKDFKDILANENVPKIVKEPGTAERYLKSQDDWNGVRTSMSAIDQAIRNGNFPTEVNDESYVLMQYNNTEVRDSDDEKDDAGYGQIDKGDFYGEDNTKVEEIDEETDNELREDLDKDSLLQRVALYNKSMNGVNIVMMSASQVAEQINALKINANNLSLNPLASSVGNIDALAGEMDVSKVISNMKHDAKDPTAEIVDDLRGEPAEKGEDGFEIKPPKV